MEFRGAEIKPSDNKIEYSESLTGLLDLDITWRKKVEDH